LFFAIINNYIKTTREGYNKFALFLKCMTTTCLASRYIVNPVGSFNFEWNMVFFLNNRKVPSWIFNFGEVNYYGLHGEKKN